MSETSPEGVWIVEVVDGAKDRLRSGRIGLMSIDVSAPVTRGRFSVTADSISINLDLGMDKLTTRNFIMQAAARTLVTRHDAHELNYQGTGRNAAPWRVSGVAKSGDVDVNLDLTITPMGPAVDPMAGIEIIGSANVGTVHLPIPGLGTVEDFSFDVDAKLGLTASTVEPSGGHPGA